MPEEEIRERGGAKEWRTVKTGEDKYIHVAIVPEAGKRGGHTIAGPMHTKKHDHTGPHHSAYSCGCTHEGPCLLNGM